MKKDAIKMLKSRNGVNDGDVYPITYDKGKIYDIGPGEGNIGPDLARVFVDEIKDAEYIAKKKGAEENKDSKGGGLVNKLLGGGDKKDEKKDEKKDSK